MFDVKNFKEIKRLKCLLVKAEAYLEPKRWSAMELFLWIYLTTYMFFYKHIRIQELGSDMVKVTQNIGWKYAYDRLILYVKIFKMGAKSVGLSHIA